MNLLCCNFSVQVRYTDTNKKYDMKKEEVIKALRAMEVDGETMQYIIEQVGMQDQMHRQLVLSFPAKATEALLEELAELNGEFTPSQIRNDRGVLIAAVSEELHELIKEEHQNWLDHSGHYAFYDLVVAIVDEMMFSEGSAYQRFIKAKADGKNVDFNHITDECFDWYHMALAKTMVTKELLHAVCFGDTKEYFESTRKKFYELAIDEGEELGTRTLKNFDSKEEADAKMKELQEMFPEMKLFIDTCTHDYVMGEK